MSTTLPAVADADVQDLAIDGSIANSNFGADKNLRVRVAPGETFETFLTFDVSAITGVGHALLKLHGGQAGTITAPVLVGAFATPNEFTEGGGSHGSPLSIIPGLLGAITWNNRPDSTGAAFEPAVVTTVGDYYWNLTDYVRASKTTGDNFVTIALRQTAGGAGQVVFGSREGDAANAPKLIIEENTAGPQATFVAPDVTAAGGTTQQITVTYSDADGIDTATLDAGDIDVRAPGGTPLEVVGVSIDPTNANAVVVTYTLAAPGGTWDAADPKAYTTLLKDAAVTDLAGNPATGGPDVFVVALDAEPPPTPADTEKPQAQITDAPPDVTDEGGTGTTVGVTFTDNVGVNADALTTASLVITRQGATGAGGVQVLDVGVQPSADGKTLVALFNVVAPGGAWDFADNGTYDVAIVPGAVTDPAGNLSTGIATSFSVDVPPPPPQTPSPDPTPVDSTGPVATVVPLDPLTEDGGSDRQIRVTYVDDIAVNLSSIDLADVVVTGPGGIVLRVTDVSVSPPAGGASVTATYTVAAPGDLWDEGDNGTYSITLAAGAATDVSDNPSLAATADFVVAIPARRPSIDPDFGGGTSTVNTGFVAEAAVSQRDGRILVVGRQGDLDAGTSRLVLQRLKLDGSLDASFGTGGKVLGPDGANEAAYAVAVDPDGNIVVVGRRGNDLMVRRFKSSGAIDNRFGAAGVAVADFGGDDVAYSVVIGADRTILAAGGSTRDGNDAFAFARFLSDGRPDLSFGTAGRSLFAQAGGGNVAGSVALDSTGRVVAAGPTDTGRVAVVRLTAAGVEDASFGTGGVMVIDRLSTRTDLGRPDRSIGVVALPDGSLLVTNHTAGGDFAIAKIGAGGTLDTSFGSAGVTTIDFGGDDDADAILLQGSGEILALGTTTADGGKLAVAAIGADGSLLSGFGEGGKLTLDATPTSSGRELRIGDLVLRAFGSVTGDGRLVVGASDQRPAAVSSSPLRRLNIPGSGSLGAFNVPGSKQTRRLTFQDADGTVVTISMKGKGIGEAFYDGSSLDLVLSGVDNGSLVIKTKGGDGRVTLRNVQADGSLRGIMGKTTDLAGTFSVSSGGVRKVSLGNLTGTLAVAGEIGSVAIAGDMKGMVLSGADYGVNGKPGGSGSAADSFAEGSIGRIRVGGSAIGATFAAGLDPVNQRFLDGDDQLVGGDASSIGAVAVRRGVDPSTRFIAGAFAKRAKLPERVDPLDDPRFMRL